jgi:hypothetical protein
MTRALSLASLSVSPHAEQPWCSFLDSAQRGGLETLPSRIVFMRGYFSKR